MLGWTTEEVMTHLNTASNTTTILNSRGEILSSLKPLAQIPLKSSQEASDHAPPKLGSYLLLRQLGEGRDF